MWQGLTAVVSQADTIGMFQPNQVETFVRTGLEKIRFRSMRAIESKEKIYYLFVTWHFLKVR